MKKFKRSGDIEKISKDCLKKVGLAEMPSTEDMSKPDFDDKVRNTYHFPEEEFF